MTQLHHTRAQQLPAILPAVLILDGAMGTMIQRFKLNEAQQMWGGEVQGFSPGHQRQQRAAEPTRPDVIQDHEGYLPLVPT
jgi:5-methyltetrahydrofolate--homocysteine methyltransferase